MIFNVYFGKYKSIMIVADRYENYPSTLDDYTVLTQFMLGDKLVAIINKKHIKRIEET